MKEENKRLKVENSVLNQVVLTMGSRLKTTSIMVEKIYELLRKKSSIIEVKQARSQIAEDNESFESLFNFPINDKETLVSFNNQLGTNHLYKKFLVSNIY